MKNNLLENCFFYKLEESNVDVCVYAADNWEDSFVAIRVNSNIFMLYGESNLHQGEKPYRKVIANLLTNDLTNVLPMQKVAMEDTSSEFRDSIKKYLNK